MIASKRKRPKHHATAAAAKPERMFLLLGPYVRLHHQKTNDDHSNVGHEEHSEHKISIETQRIGDRFVAFSDLNKQ